MPFLVVHWGLPCLPNAVRRLAMVILLPTLLWTKSAAADPPGAVKAAVHCTALSKKAVVFLDRYPPMPAIRIPYVYNGMCKHICSKTPLRVSYKANIGPRGTLSWNQIRILHRNTPIRKLSSEKNTFHGTDTFLLVEVFLCYNHILHSIIKSVHISLMPFCLSWRTSWIIGCEGLEGFNS